MLNSLAGWFIRKQCANEVIIERINIKVIHLFFKLVPTLKLHSIEAHRSWLLYRAMLQTSGAQFVNDALLSTLCASERILLDQWPEAKRQRLPAKLALGITKKASDPFCTIALVIIITKIRGVSQLLFIWSYFLFYVHKNCVALLRVSLFAFLCHLDWGLSYWWW